MVGNISRLTILTAAICTRKYFYSPPPLNMATDLWTASKKIAQKSVRERHGKKSYIRPDTPPNTSSDTPLPHTTHYYMCVSLCICVCVYLRRVFFQIIQFQEKKGLFYKKGNIKLNVPSQFWKIELSILFNLNQNPIQIKSNILFIFSDAVKMQILEFFSNSGQLNS